MSMDCGECAHNNLKLEKKIEKLKKELTKKQEIIDILGRTSCAPKNVETSFQKEK